MSGKPIDEAVRAQFEWADLPWRAAVGWLRSASGSKILEVGDHDGCITQRESELIAAAVNAYTAAQQQGQARGVVDEAMVERGTAAAIAASTRHARTSAVDAWRQLVREVLTAALAAQPGGSDNDR